MANVLDKQAAKKTEDHSETFPTAYAPFLPVIERLSDPLKTVLFGHLQSLESIFHTVQSRDRHLVGEFEGIGGLTQRGDINRILQSELLLRTEAPLEFLRRILENETLYMETEHSDPGEKTVYRLMISVGPSLLGHGRIIALACLLFLARIAHVRKTELHWCFAPNKNGIHWFTDISVNSVKRFLKFASYADASQADAEQAHAIWQDVFAEDWPHDVQYQDWLIGAQDGSHDNTSRHVHRAGESPALLTAPNALILSINPPDVNAPDVENRNGDITLKRGGSVLRRLAINFPPDSVCVSALNNPFRPLSPTRTASQDGAQLPKLGGWEPRYLCSYGANHHIVRFSNFRPGLLFLHTGQNSKIIHSAFLPLPENVQLAGVTYSPKNNSVMILVQITQDGTEMMALNQFKTRSGHHHKIYKKKVISAHLFAKQRSHTIPILHSYDGAKCYTTLGQAFHFSTAETDSYGANLNILYKEKRIIAATGTHKILYYDPKNKTYAERMSEGENGDYETPSLQIIKGMNKTIAHYPVPKSFNKDQLRGMVFSMSNRGLAYCTAPGTWRVLSSLGHNFKDFDEMTINIEPYAQILRSSIRNLGAKIMTYSDLDFGGDGALQTSIHTGTDTIQKATLHRYKQQGNKLVGLNDLSDGSIWGVRLDEQGDPATIVVLRKKSGIYQKHEIDLNALLSHIQEIKPEDVFG